MRLGKNEAAIYSNLVAPKSPNLFTLSEVAPRLREATSTTSLSHTLSSLDQKGVIERVGKGLYINKSTGVMPRAVDLILNLFKNSTCYLALNSAANHWGFTPQLPYIYHVIFLPRSEAERKRVSRWSEMLEGKESTLGGVIAPVTSRTGNISKLETTQAMFEGIQLPISTKEKTIVDAMVYTDEIGGIGDATAWVRTSLGTTALINWEELERILEVLWPKLKSPVVRMGFLLEFLLERTDEVEKDTLDRCSSLVSILKQRVARTSSTFSWGERKHNTQYFDDWHLHLSYSYLREIEEELR